MHGGRCSHLRYRGRLTQRLRPTTVRIELDPVVRQQARTVDVHRPDQAVSTLTEDHVLDGLEVLPGFSCVVSTVFRAYSARIPRGSPRWPSAALTRPGDSEARFLKASVSGDGEGEPGCRGVMTSKSPKSPSRTSWN